MPTSQGCEDWVRSRIICILYAIKLKSKVLVRKKFNSLVLTQYSYISVSLNGMLCAHIAGKGSTSG